VCDSCKNNGKLRGLLYVLLAGLPVLAEHIKGWIETPPKNGYEIAWVCILTALACGTVLRAYLDQHLSDTKNTSP